MNRIEISQPRIDVDASMAYLKEALESGQIAQGRQVLAAEQELGTQLDASHAAMVSSGTAALKAALVSSVCKVRGIDPQYIDRELPDAEVIVPAFSFNATLNSVLQIGAKAVVADIKLDDYCLDGDQAVELATEGTVAIMPVDLYGQAANTRSVEEWAEANRVAIVRDAAQAHGAKIDGDHIVHHSNATSLSFYPTKNIAAPEGGAVITDDPEIDEIVRIYRNQGMRARYEYLMSGDNLRMTDVHAAVLRPNIGMVAIFAAKRDANAQALSQGLSEIEGIVVPARDATRDHVWHQYTILVDDSFGMTRNELSAVLNERGIGSGVYYPKTMVDHPSFTDHPRIRVGNIKNAEYVAQRALSLPVHPGVSQSDIERIIETIADIRRG